MSRFKRIVAASALLLGVVGALASLAIVFGTLVAESRLRTAAESAYSQLDDLFSQAGARIRQLDEVVNRARMTTTNMRDMIAAWSRSPERERVNEEQEEKLELRSKASDLAATLVKADSFAEMSADSVSMVIRVVDLANTGWARINKQGLQSLHSEIEQLRGNLKEAVNELAKLSMTGPEDVDLSGFQNRSVVAAEVTEVVLETIQRVQSALQRLDDKFSDAQRTVANSRPALLGWARAAAVTAIALMIWNFAGQCALGHIGWQSIRQ